jgi:hypothetical protein
MYGLYKEWCEETKLEPVSQHFYRMVFNTRFNLGFGSPRSDTCSLCDAGKDERHEARAALAFEAQKLDKTKARSDSKTVFVTFDLQKTLPLPKLSTSKAFYLRQVWLYNLGVHFVTCKTNGKIVEQPYFNIWTEDQGHRGCVEVCSSLMTFIEESKVTDEHSLILWSDSCAGQNKIFVLFYASGSI